MSLSDKTFEYLTPTEKQKAIMDELRPMWRNVAASLQHCLPDGPDKTWIIRELRTIAMWANVCVTRNQDGSPRD